MQYLQSANAQRWLIPTHSSCYLFSRAVALAVTVLASLFAAPVALAQQYPPGSKLGVDGATMFKVCSFCHGAQGQGGPALDAPPLAGMEAWYVERQLNAFRARQRGTHPEDVPGLQMSIVSGMVRNATTIANVAAYIESMTPGAPPEKTVNGEVAGTERPFVWRSKYAKLAAPNSPDVNKGAAIYQATCIACHADKGQGIKGLGAPKLTDLPEWYMHRQLQYFKDGVRGTDTQDVYGMQMAPFAKLLADEQAIADVVAYINSL
jgi:cytochrome c oxidase subunit 2